MHGSGMGVAILISAALVAWGAVAARLTRLTITMPFSFVVVGAVAHQLGWIRLSIESPTLLTFAELTLALVLFGDAAGVDLGRLRRDKAIAIRLLLIGLPLTILAGTLTAWLLVPGATLAIAAVVGASVSPTDAALGLPIVQDERVPAFVRRMLIVESGLNDGIATPFVTCAIAWAASELAGGPNVGGAFVDLAVGVAIGAGVGWLGGAIIARAVAAGWTTDAARAIAVPALAILSYAVAVASGGNGFVAAFVGGLAFGAVTPEVHRVLPLIEELGSIAASVLWLLFGVVLAAVWHWIGWVDVVFAVLALTVVRMVPVALCLVGSGLDRATVAFVGWAGPRGLASIVFTLLTLEGVGAESARPAVIAIMTTVAASVAAHGFSAAPLSARFGATPRRSPNVVGPQATPTER